MNKIKLFIFLLILSSFVGYLEWAGDNQSFLLETEIEIIKKSSEDISSIAHPLIFIPFFGQLILIISLFLKNPSNKLIYTAIISIGILMGLILFIGLLEFNYKILLSTFPFFILSILIIRTIKKAH